MAPRENLVTQDLREPPDLRVRRAREDPLVSLVPLDQLVPVEPEAPPVAVVCQEVREEPDLWVCPALVVLLDLLDLVDPLEMLVVLASLDPLVSGVSQEALEALDHQERRDLLVLLDKMVALDLPAQPDPEASPETLASLDLRDLVVRLASPETKEPLVPLV